MSTWSQTSGGKIKKLQQFATCPPNLSRQADQKTKQWWLDYLLRPHLSFISWSHPQGQTSTGAGFSLAFGSLVKQDHIESEKCNFFFFKWWRSSNISWWKQPRGHEAWWTSVFFPVLLLHFSSVSTFAVAEGTCCMMDAPWKAYLMSFSRKGTSCRLMSVKEEEEEEVEEEEEEGKEPASTEALLFMRGSIWALSFQSRKSLSPLYASGNWGSIKSKIMNQGGSRSGVWSWICLCFLYHQSSSHWGKCVMKT